MPAQLLKFCLTLCLCLITTGCIPKLWNDVSPKSDIAAESINKGEKALVVFRANTADGSTVETQ